MRKIRWATSHEWRRGRWRGWVQAGVNLPPYGGTLGVTATYERNRGVLDGWRWVVGLHCYGLVGYGFLGIGRWKKIAFGGEPK